MDSGTPFPYGISVFYTKKSKLFSASVAVQHPHEYSTAFARLLYCILKVQTGTLLRLRSRRTKVSLHKNRCSLTNESGICSSSFISDLFPFCLSRQSRTEMENNRKNLPFLCLFTWKERFFFVQRKEIKYEYLTKKYTVVAAGNRYTRLPYPIAEAETASSHMTG